MALTGGSISIMGLDGGKVDVPLGGITNPGSTRIIRGEGMPVNKLGGKNRGDLHIKIEVEFPKQLREDQKQQLRKILVS